MDNNSAVGAKQVKDIFKDYVAENTISNCYVGAINLFKKTNKLDISSFNSIVFLPSTNISLILELYLSISLIKLILSDKLEILFKIFWY